MPRARRYMVGNLESLGINPDTPVLRPGDKMTEPVGTPVGTRMTGAGYFVAQSAEYEGKQANTVFTPAEMDARLAAIEERIARDNVPAHSTLPKSDKAEDAARSRRVASQIRCRNDEVASRLVVVNCCLCKTVLLGARNTVSTAGRTIERVAHKDPDTLLSYCAGCADGVVRVKIIDTPPDSGKD
jgi:hypothetical protein